MATDPGGLPSAFCPTLCGTIKRLQRTVVGASSSHLRPPLISSPVRQEREDQVNRHLQIRLLLEHEAAELTDTAKFNALRPIRCKSCGNTYDFGRRVFRIGGVPKAERNSESTQALIAYHLKERHGVGSVFFKTYRNEFYVDSAICKRCASTVIEFDVELSDEVLAEVSRVTARPIEELRSEIEALAERIAEDDRNAEQSHATDRKPPGQP